MRLRTSILGLATILAFCGAIVCQVLFSEPKILYGSWAFGVVLGLLWIVLNRVTLVSFLKLKSTRYGANVAFVLFLVLGILVFVNILGKQHNVRKDLTRSGANSLSPQTLKVLRELPQEVNAQFFQSLQEKDKSEAVLKSFAYEGKKFKYEFVDILRSPTRAQAMGVKKPDTVFLTIAGDENKKIKVDGITEESLVNGLMKLQRAQEKRIYFTTGHDEHAVDAENDPVAYSELKSELEKQGYAVRELNLFSEGKVPDDAAVLIVGGPKKSFFPKELEVLAAWIKGGGRMLLTVDLDVAESGLAKGSRQAADLLRPFSVNVKDQMLVDPTSQLANVEPQVLLGFAGSMEHPVSRDFPHKKNAANFLFPLTAYLTFEEKPEFIVTPLVWTSTKAWAESDWGSLKSGRVKFDPGADFQGQMDLAYAIESRPPEVKPDEQAKPDDPAAPAKAASRLIVFANAMFATNNLIDKVGNRDLILNSIAWLADDERFISIRAKEDQDDLRQYSNSVLNLILIFTVFVIPLATILLGVSVWWRRSKL